jgi:hypothetical protein
MGHALADLYHNYDLPFFFASMITDSNSVAMDRRFEYGFGGYPTAFYDAGYYAGLGAPPEGASFYDTTIARIGARDIAELDLEIDITWLGNAQLEIHVYTQLLEFVSDPPASPETPTGDIKGGPNFDYEFTTSSTDPEGDDILYRFNWDSGDTSAWIGPYPSGEVVTASHQWSIPGTYDIEVQARDTLGNIGDWSENEHTITIMDYLAGDANNDEIINIKDISFLIKFKYKGGPAPDPYEAGDADGNIIVNIKDITYLIKYKYKDGPKPVYPE